MHCTKNISCIWSLLPTLVGLTFILCLDGNSLLIDLPASAFAHSLTLVYSPHSSQSDPFKTAQWLPIIVREKETGSTSAYKAQTDHSPHLSDLSPPPLPFITHCSHILPSFCVLTLLASSCQTSDSELWFCFLYPPGDFWPFDNVGRTFVVTTGLGCVPLASSK